MKQGVLNDQGRGSWQAYIGNFLLPLLVVVVVVGVGLIIHLDQRHGLPKIDDFVHCDAGWYIGMVQDGYFYDPTGPNNTAFFPFFPYVWRWSGFGPLGISIFNAILFIVSNGILFSMLRPGWRAKLFYLGLSLLLFYIFPFSEGLFCFFCMLILVGLRQKKHWMVVIGILGSGLARSVSTIFVPAFLLIGIVEAVHDRRFRSFLPYLAYIAASIATTLAVFSIQWYQTGEFFAFTKTQKRWSTEWQLPKLPFYTWGSEDNWLYDQLALFVCLLCFVWSLVYFVRVVARKVEKPKPALLMSIFYCCGIGLMMLFTKGGRFNSANRYIFATPFLLGLVAYLEHARIRKWYYAIVAVLGIAFFHFCWEMSVSLERALNAIGIILFCCMLPTLIRNRNKWVTGLACLLIAGLLYVQSHFWFRFLNDEWVG